MVVKYHSYIYVSIVIIISCNILSNFAEIPMKSRLNIKGTHCFCNDKHMFQKPIKMFNGVGDGKVIYAILEALMLKVLVPF